jgi:hypothetical protein
MNQQRLEEIKTLRESMKDLKDKDFKTLSTTEKDALLETALKILGLIK